MGTRALVRVFEDGKEIVAIYRQMDGYPEEPGLGAEVRDFVVSKSLVNGFTGDAKFRSFNGMGCLAAQLVTFLKHTGRKHSVLDGGKWLDILNGESPDIEVGSVYLYPPDTKDVGEEYEYHVCADGKGGVEVKAFEVSGHEGERKLGAVEIPAKKVAKEKKGGV
jgi:hypothetical protein